MFSLVDKEEFFECNNCQSPLRKNKLEQKKLADSSIIDICPNCKEEPHTFFSHSYDRR